MSILEQLADHARERVTSAKAKQPVAGLRREALALPKGDFPFEQALAGDELAFICECKKASPSKGLIAEEYPYLEIAKEYESAGAEAISVLTEPRWFLGNDDHLRRITAAVSVPCLRKDFTVDEYMLYEAKLFGASAALLICSILDIVQLQDYLQICEELGLSALVETHDEAEVDMALSAGARMIGVNNRDLKNFSVDTDNSRRLRRRIPRNVLFVSESGIQNPGDIRAVREMGADAVLVGEVLMRAEDKRVKLAELRGSL